MLKRGRGKALMGHVSRTFERQGVVRVLEGVPRDDISISHG